MSKLVVVATLQDSAAADVAREAIADAGIAAEVRRLGGDAYFGSGTAYSYEVRVPGEAVDDARRVLTALEEDMEQAAIAAAGVPPGEEDERGSAALPPVEERPRKIAWAVALALVGPLPGVGALYARAFALGWTFVGMSLAGIVAGFALDSLSPFRLVIALKVADVLLAPWLAARFNRKLEDRNAAHP